VIFGQRDNVGGCNPQGHGAAIEDGCAWHGMNPHARSSERTGLWRAANDDHFPLHGNDLLDQIRNIANHRIRRVDRRDDNGEDRSGWIGIHVAGAGCFSTGA
jgi:hypothetical protein